MHRLRSFSTLAAVLCSTPVLALSPSEVFDKVSASVWAVRGMDAQERPFSHGSAVVIGVGQLVTSCHVLAKAKSIQLRREDVAYEAKLEHADVERDLCLLSAKRITAVPVAIGTLAETKVGQRVFAIAIPERRGLTLSEGMVSGLQSEEGKPMLQSSAALLPGSSGGGLFDERGVLIGITRYQAAPAGGAAQALNIALPAEWIGDVAPRSREQRAKRSEPAAPELNTAKGGLPRVGASWKYGFRDRQYSGPQRIFTIRISSVDEREVRESFSVVNGVQSSDAVNPEAVSFAARRLAHDSFVVELAPYFFPGDAAKWAIPLRPSGYPGAPRWQVGLAQVQPDDVTVPAGAYKAIRVDVKGLAGQFGSLGMSAAGSVHHLPAKFHYTSWYVPQVNRYVMARHRTWNASDSLIGDELIQLLEFRSQ
jgi:S1-C subfamily serine protease